MQDPECCSDSTSFLTPFLLTLCNSASLILFYFAVFIYLRSMKCQRESFYSWKCEINRINIQMSGHCFSTFKLFGQIGLRRCQKQKHQWIIPCQRGIPVKKGSKLLLMYYCLFLVNSCAQSTNIQWSLVSWVSLINCCQCLPLFSLLTRMFNRLTTCVSWPICKRFLVSSANTLIITQIVIINEQLDRDTKWKFW